jgi:hypothetical protein
MSTTYGAGGLSEAAAYGGLADVIGGIGTAVLAIVALAGVDSGILLGIATIVFGAALAIQAATFVSEYVAIAFPTGAAATAAGLASFAGDGVLFLFMAGAAGVVLGILALLGIAPLVLSSVALIAFGAALLLSSTSLRHLYQLRSIGQAAGPSGVGLRTGKDFLAGQMASGSAAAQILSGIAAVVLGILVLSGVYSGVLTLVGLLIVGVSNILAGGALSGAVMGMRPRASAP